MALTGTQWDAVTEAFTTLRAIYESYKDGEQAQLAVLAGESLASLTAAFPHLAKLDEACGASCARAAARLPEASPGDPPKEKPL